jgi:sulfane dehydrogenase subunit SoxC
LSPDGIKQVMSEAKSGRRNFIRSAFAAAAAGATLPVAMAQSNPVPVEGGDPNILNLPEHSKGLGQGVAPDGSYGKPSKYESTCSGAKAPA